MSDPRPPAEIEARPAPGGPDDRLLGWRRVKEITGISRSTAWRLQRTGAFPEAVQISPGRIAWWESELAAWKRTRAPRRDTPAAAPAGCRSLRPARAPGLPGIPRSMPAPPSAAPPRSPAASPAIGPGGAQPHPAPPHLSGKSAAKAAPARRRRQVVSPDQFDFGF